MSIEHKNPKADLFAEIGAYRAAHPMGRLFEPTPPKLPERYLPTGKSDPSAAFRPAPKLDTTAKLQRELTRQRRGYAKFMKNLAPAPPATRIVVHLKAFDWRKETGADQKDFRRVLTGKGRWEKVQVPHFGEPLGRAVTYYRITFSVTRAKRWIPRR